MGRLCFVYIALVRMVICQMPGRFKKFDIRKYCVRLQSWPPVDIIEIQFAQVYVTLTHKEITEAKSEHSYCADVLNGCFFVITHERADIGLGYRRIEKSFRVVDKNAPVSDI